jgi:hypothetical protein
MHHYRYIYPQESDDCRAVGTEYAGKRSLKVLDILYLYKLQKVIPRNKLYITRG